MRKKILTAKSQWFLRKMLELFWIIK